MGKHTRNAPNEIAVQAQEGFEELKQQVMEEVSSPPELEEEAQEEEKSFEELTPAEKAKQLVELVAKNYPRANLSEEEVLSWKQRFGEIFVLALANKVFVFRALSRQENIVLQKNEGFVKSEPHQQEEALFRKCVLFPTFDPVQMAAAPAGTVSLVVSQINLNSLFINPEIASNFVFTI